MIVMDGRLVLFLAIVPAFVQAESTLDLWAFKYVERNGGCFVDVYEPSATELNPEPWANSFIRQTFKSECYRNYSVRGFNLLEKENKEDGYYLMGCFYFKESQTLKCGQLKGKEFDEGMILKICTDFK
uniref:Uncharacterized protein n=1 Tax=Panagrolaimus sp. JU765 TaxID=591449 RepID=A0AC34Q8F3_9BILA